MEQHYKLFRVRELADNDEDFIASLAEAFLEEVPSGSQNETNGRLIRIRCT